MTYKYYCVLFDPLFVTKKKAVIVYNGNYLSTNAPLRKIKKKTQLKGFIIRIIESKFFPNFVSLGAFKILNFWIVFIAFTQTAPYNTHADCCVPE